MHKADASVSKLTASCGFVSGFWRPVLPAGPRPIDQPRLDTTAAGVGGRGRCVAWDRGIRPVCAGGRTRPFDDRDEALRRQV